jgi:hypothetical protein
VNGLVTLEDCSRGSISSANRDMEAELSSSSSSSSSSTIDNLKLRAVTIASVFSPALWLVYNSSTLSGMTLTQRDAEFCYAPSDFSNISLMGLNGLQFPVTIQLFDESQSKNSTSLSESIGQVVQICE